MYILRFVDIPSSTFYYDAMHEEEEIIGTEGGDGHDVDRIQIYLRHFTSNNPEYDTVSGVRREDDDLYIGNCRVDFEHGRIILYNDNKKMRDYGGSPELYNAIFLRNPKPLTDEQDILKYRDI